MAIERNVSEDCAEFDASIFCCYRDDSESRLMLLRKSHIIYTWDFKFEIFDVRHLNLFLSPGTVTVGMSGGRLDIKSVCVQSVLKLSPALNTDAGWSDYILRCWHSLQHFCIASSARVKWAYALIFRL